MLRKPPSVTAALVVNWVEVVSVTRDVVPTLESTTHRCGGRSEFGGHENDMERGCGKSKRPERKKSRGGVRAYLWKLARESPNASRDKTHGTRESLCAGLHKRNIRPSGA